VRIVTLNSAVEGDWVQNPCDSREFTGTLLERTAKIHPAAIVVDWSNAPNGCRDSKTNDLFKEKAQSANTLAPVLFGRSTWNEQSLRKDMPKVTEKLPHDALRPDRFIAQDDFLDGSGIVF